jgi:hypothetical protein
MHSLLEATPEMKKDGISAVHYHLPQIGNSSPASTFTNQIGSKTLHTPLVMVMNLILN